MTRLSLVISLRIREAAFHAVEKGLGDQENSWRDNGIEGISFKG